MQPPNSLRLEGFPDIPVALETILHRGDRDADIFQFEADSVLSSHLPNNLTGSLVLLRNNHRDTFTFDSSTISVIPSSDTSTLTIRCFNLKHVFGAGIIY